jgi:hypothetical protein
MMTTMVIAVTLRNMVAGADIRQTPDLSTFGQPEITKIERDVCVFGRHPRDR